MARELAQVVLDACALLDPQLQGAPKARVGAVAEGLTGNLRIAVAGRVKAGKSTLVNALLGRRVAPTGVGECTAVVTVFRYGSPERLELVMRDGSAKELPLERDGSLPETLGCEPGDVEYAIAWISNQTLEGIDIIDTPGLASADQDRSEATVEFLALDQASRSAVARADAMIFLLTQAPHHDEVAALEAFRSMVVGVAATAATAVGVFNKIDAMGGSDPFATAAPLIERYRATLRASVATVVPVVSLLAETALAGLLTEDDANNLQVLAATPAAEQKRMLLTADRFLAADSPVPLAARERLLELLDLHGLREAFQAIGSGARGANRLARHLERVSAIDPLKRLVQEAFAVRADSLKAEWGLSALERIASDESLPPETSQLIRSAVEEVRLLPAMQHLGLVSALEQCARGDVALPDELLVDLRSLASVPNAGAVASVAEALEGISRWKRYENDSRRNPSEKHVARAARRAYEARWVAFDKSGSA